jgi:hypothetical protein
MDEARGLDDGPAGGFQFLRGLVGHSCHSKSR